MSSSNFSFLSVLSVFGCTSEAVPEIEIELPTATYGVPEEENSIVMTVVKSDQHSLGFAVHLGAETTSQTRLVADTQDELAQHLQSHIDARMNLDPNLKAVVIECQRDVRTGDVEMIKSAVSNSLAAETLQLYVSIREN